MVTSNKLYNLLLKGCFRIKGRSSRLEYILRFLMMIFMCLFFPFIADSDNSDNSGSKPYILFMFLVALILFILLVASVIQMFFVTHRRLHDLNASGWWQLITLIPFGQLLMIGFIFFKGTDGPNNYGPPPEY